MNSSLLYYQWTACLARFTWAVCKMGFKWQYHRYFVASYFQDLFNLFLKFPSNFFFILFDGIQVVHPYSCTDSVKTCKKSCFLLLESLCSVIAKALDCCLEISGFELQSGYYIYFRTNTLRKGMNLRQWVKYNQYCFSSMVFTLNNPRRWICQ